MSDLTQQLAELRAQIEALPAGAVAEVVNALEGDARRLLAAAKNTPQEGEAREVREDAINVGARVGDEFRARSQFPIGEGRVVLSIVRYDDGTVGLLFNGESVGTPRFLTAPNAPVMPFLFVQQSGVVVSVTDFVAELD